MKLVSLSDLSIFARDVLKRLPMETTRATVVILVGELGAGKTTFMQALASVLGVVDTVQSPTYVLMKSYPISYNQFTKLVHIDAYRLNNAEEFEALKPEQFFNDPHALVCIEWPERVGSALPEAHIVLKFSSENAGEKERYISVG